MKLVLIMTVVSGMLAGGQVMLKTGLNRIGGFRIGGFTGPGILAQLIKLFANGWILGGLFMIASQMIIWFWVLSKYDLTRAYPLISMSYIFGLIFATAFLGEHPSFMRIAGTILIVAGVAMVAKL